MFCAPQRSSAAVRVLTQGFELEIGFAVQQNITNHSETFLISWECLRCSNVVAKAIYSAFESRMTTIDPPFPPPAAADLHPRPPCKSYESFSTIW